MSERFVNAGSVEHFLETEREHKAFLQTRHNEMFWKEPAAQEKKKQATERKGIHTELFSCSLYLVSL